MHTSIRFCQVNCLNRKLHCSLSKRIGFSSLTALIIFVSYILGFVVSWLLVKYQSKANIYLQQLTNIYQERLQAKKRVTHSCSICDDLSCQRHQKSKRITPWKHLQISKKLNRAIEHVSSICFYIKLFFIFYMFQFYEKIIENFINSWYKQLTDDQDFTNELRFCLRYSTALVINRFLELDIGEIISRKIFPCVIKHIDDYVYIEQIGKLKNAKFNDVIVEYLGKRLHAAATNRKNELCYLQHLVTSILNHILPEDYLKCRYLAIYFHKVFSQKYISNLIWAINT